MGGYFLRFIGVVIIYLYKSIISLFQGKTLASFRKIWSEPHNDDFSASVTSELKQKIIGLVFIVLFVMLLYWFPNL